MLDMVFLKAQQSGINIKRIGKKRANVTRRLLPLTQPDKIQNLGRIRECVLDFLGQIGIAVLSDRDMIDIGDLRAHRIEAGFNRERRKAAVMFAPVETLFRDREHHFPVLHNGC